MSLVFGIKTMLPLRYLAAALIAGGHPWGLGTGRTGLSPTAREMLGLSVVGRTVGLSLLLLINTRLEELRTRDLQDGRIAHPCQDSAIVPDVASSLVCTSRFILIYVNGVSGFGV